MEPYHEGKSLEETIYISIRLSVSINASQDLMYVLCSYSMQLCIKG